MSGFGISHFSWFLAGLLAIGTLSLQAAESPPGAPRKSSEMRERQSRQVMARASKKKRMFSSSSRKREMDPYMENRVAIKSKQRRATELIQTQEQPKVSPRVLNQAINQKVSILISLARQRIYLKVGEEVAIDSPLCSGKAAGMTPRGQFTILEKDPDHRSSIYGDFVDRNGEIVRSGVSLKIDSAPSGTTFVGAPMRWFMRLTRYGIGMHAGILPGYPASHGCIRLPEQVAKLIYDCAKIGTLVVVTD